MELSYEQIQEKLNEIKDEIYDLFPTAKEIKLTLKDGKILVERKEDYSK
jgi:hypothetical protein